MLVRLGSIGRVLVAVGLGTARELWFWLAGLARLLRHYTAATISSSGWLLVTAWQGWWNLFSVVAAPVLGFATWRRVWPPSFLRRVSEPLWRRRVRRATRKAWPVIMDNCGLARRTSRTLAEPIVTVAPPLRRLGWRDGRLSATPELLIGQTVDSFESAADALRVALDADRIKIVPNKTLTGCSIVWGFGDPLERPVRITVPAPDAPVGSLDTVVLGMTEEDQPWRHAFRIPTLGAGVSDSGKSSLMQAELIQLGPAIKAGLVRACGIDLKGGNELAFDEPMLTSHARKPESAVALLEQLVTALEDRLDRQAGVVREHTPTVSEPLVVLYIDELAALTAYLMDRDLVRRGEAALGRLLTAGRAAGFIVHGFVQDPRKETIKMRHLFRQAIGLRLREREEVPMVLSDGALAAGAWCHRIPESMKGVGYVLTENGGRPVRVRGFLVKDDDIRLAAARFPAPQQIPIILPVDPPATVRTRTTRRAAGPTSTRETGS